MTDAIPAHGGTLIDRTVNETDRSSLEKAAAAMPVHRLDRRACSDLEMIVIGGFSPLDGFMGQADYDRVVKEMRLANGLPWSIPINLPAREDEARRLNVGDDVALCDETGVPLAVLQLKEKYRPDKRREADLV